MAEKHPTENLNDLNIPKEFTPQLELLKNTLLQIDVRYIFIQVYFFYIIKHYKSLLIYFLGLGT